MTLVELNGVDIHFERMGQGTKLLFLNGSGATISSTFPLIASLAQHFDVVVADQRGLGESAMPSTSYAMADLADDAIALVDYLEWSRFCVLGVSFGGMIAQELAVAIPDRIERLVLLCTSPGGVGGSSYPLHELIDMNPDERTALYTKILDTRFTAAWLAEHEGDRALVDVLVSQQGNEKSSEVLAGEALQMEARRGHDVSGRLRQITCRTLVAAGNYDGIAPVANSAAIVEALPRGALRTYEGGHMFFLQDPAAFPEITAFLSS